MIVYRPPWPYAIVDVFPFVYEPLVPFRLMLLETNFCRSFPYAKRMYFSFSIGVYAT